MSEYILEVKGITKRFPGVKALGDVSFKILPGEVHGLIGENGAGKSTLLKIICENVEFLHGIAIILGNKPSETKLYKSSAEENTENQVSNTKEQ